MVTINPPIKQIRFVFGYSRSTKKKPSAHKRYFIGRGFLYARKRISCALFRYFVTPYFGRGQAQVLLV